MGVADPAVGGACLWIPPWWVELTRCGWGAGWWAGRDDGPTLVGGANVACCSLRRQVSAINRLAQERFFFWDYGNAFLLEAQRAGGSGEQGGWAWAARACRCAGLPGGAGQGPLSPTLCWAPGMAVWVLTSGGRFCPQERTWRRKAPIRRNSATPRTSSTLWGECRSSRWFWGAQCRPSPLSGSGAWAFRRKKP